MSTDTTQKLPNGPSFEERVFARFDSLDARMSSMEERQERMEARLERMEERQERMEARQERMEARQERMEGRLDEIDRRLDDMDRRLKVSLRHKTYLGACDCRDTGASGRRAHSRSQVQRYYQRLDHSARRAVPARRSNGQDGFETRLSPSDGARTFHDVTQRPRPRCNPTPILAVQGKRLP